MKLYEMGLTNRDSEDIGCYVNSVKRITLARCTSFKCSKRKDTSHGVVKNVKKGETWCPDCGNVLLWRNEIVKSGNDL